MTGKKLYKADLRGTNFANADLSNANLFGAFAKDASFKCGLLCSAGMHLHSPRSCLGCMHGCDIA